MNLAAVVCQVDAHTVDRHTSPGHTVYFNLRPATYLALCAALQVGIVPALSLLSPAQNPPSGPILLSTTQLLAWSAALAFFGVFLAVPLRTQTIIKCGEAWSHPRSRQTNLCNHPDRI